MIGTAAAMPVAGEQLRGESDGQMYRYVAYSQALRTS